MASRAAARYRKTPILSALAVAYIEISRNTPLLIQLFFLYYGLPKIGIRTNLAACGVAGLAFLGGATWPKSRELLAVENLVKRYGENTVLDNVSFRGQEGETLVIIGPSGCGKSMLLRCINALEPIQGGRILLDGQEISRDAKSLPKLRQRIGMVFQNYELFPHLNALDNITLAPIKVQKRKRAEVVAEAMALLERVGLKDCAFDFPRQLSGGQKQRILSLLLLLSVTACGSSTPAAQSGDGDSGGGENVYRTLEEIKAAGSVNIGVFSDKKPFGYVDENGDYQGYDIYFAERIGQDFGVTVNYVSTEAANRGEYLETGKADIILANFTVTAERAEKVDFALPSSTPHAELLEIVPTSLNEKEIDLDIVIYDDYVLPNTALQDGELDANYFQHTPYLLSFNAANGTDLVSAGRIHYKPFGIYSYSVTALQDLSDTIFPLSFAQA